MPSLADTDSHQPPGASSSPSSSSSPAASSPSSFSSPSSSSSSRTDQSSPEVEDQDILPFESVFFMGFFKLSKVVASSAWKNITGDDLRHSKGDLASSAIISQSSGASPSSPSPPSPPSSPGSPSAGGSNSRASGTPFPPPSKEKGWNEMCLGMWKKTPGSDEDGKGHCVGVAVIRASNRKELEELVERPVTGIRLCILSEEMEREKAIEKLKAKAEAPVAVSKPTETVSVRETIKLLVEKEYQFVKRFTSKILSGEVFTKVAHAASYTATKIVKDIKEKFSGKNSS